MMLKNILKSLGFGTMAIIAGVGAAHAAGAAGDPCILINSLKGVFTTLRTLAFVGSAFFIAGWAWDYISKGKAEMKDVKEKGIGLLVGFALLFSVGIVLQFLPGIAGCPGIYSW